MFFRKAFVVAFAFCCCGFATAQDGSLHDVQLGMEGIMQATKDPALLAQLMKDMQVRNYSGDALDTLVVVVLFLLGLVT